MPCPAYEFDRTTWRRLPVVRYDAWNSSAEGNMADVKTRRVTAYVVQRRNWWYNDEYFVSSDGTEVQTFLSREKAEAYRREKERDARKQVEFDNPFWFQGMSWDDWSSV